MTCLPRDGGREDGVGTGPSSDSGWVDGIGVVDQGLHLGSGGPGRPGVEIRRDEEFHPFRNRYWSACRDGDGGGSGKDPGTNKNDHLTSLSFQDKRIFGGLLGS